MLVRPHPSGAFRGRRHPVRKPAATSIDRLVELVTADMERVNATILSRTGPR
jgi:hypothetical protein